LNVEVWSPTPTNTPITIDGGEPFEVLTRAVVAEDNTV
jgi:hypothetical protein